MVDFFYSLDFFFSRKSLSAKTFNETRMPWDMSALKFFFFLYAFEKTKNPYKAENGSNDQIRLSLTFRERIMLVGEETWSSVSFPTHACQVNSD